MEFLETKTTKPCSGCPFARTNDNEKPNPGGSHPSVYLGQTRGPFWLPCHQDKHYDGKASCPTKVRQCAGAAIFRSNIGLEYKLPNELLHLEVNHEKVFSTEAEFLSYYLEIDINDCERLLTKDTLDILLNKELRKISIINQK